MAGSGINIPIILTASVQNAEAGIRAVTGGINNVAGAVGNAISAFQRLAGASQIKATVPTPAPPPESTQQQNVPSSSVATVAQSGLAQAQRVLEAFRQIDQGAVDASDKIKKYLPEGLQEAMDQMLSESKRANEQMLSDAIQNAEAKKEAYLKVYQEQMAAQDNLDDAQAAKDAAPRGTKTAYNDVIKEAKAELKAKTDAANAAYQATEKADKQAAASAETAAKSISSAYINAGKEKEKAEQQAQKVIEDAAKQEQKAQENAAKASQKAYENFTRSVKQGFNEIQRLGSQALNNLNRMANGFRQMSQAFQEITQMVAFAIAAPVGLFLKSATSDAMSFEQAMAKVKKAVVFDNATGSFDQLAQRIRNLAKITPTTAEELATFAEQAGQIGIEGMPAVYRFTNLMNKLMIGTDVNADTISEDMGRIANAFGMDLNTETGMSQMERLASVMDKVAKVTATDMDGIVSAVKDAAVIGPMLNIPTHAVVAMVGELISSGIDASAAGTNLSRFFTGALKNADKFAEMMKGYKREIIDDAAGTVVGFTEPYKDMQSVIDEINAHPIDVLTDAMASLAEATDADRAQALKNFFDSIGFVGARVGAMAKNYQQLRELIRAANKEMDTATTLQADYTAMLMTSQSQLQIAKNNFRDLGITIGSAVLPQLNQLLQYAIPVMQMLADKFMSLSPAMQMLVVGVPLLVVALTPVLFIVATLFHSIGLLTGAILSLITGMWSMGGVVGTVVGKLAMGIGPIGEGWQGCLGWARPPKRPQQARQSLGAPLPPQEEPPEKQLGCSLVFSAQGPVWEMCSPRYSTAC